MNILKYLCCVLGMMSYTALYSAQPQASLSTDSDESDTEDIITLDTERMSSVFFTRRLMLDEDIRYWHLDKHKGQFESGKAVLLSYIQECRQIITDAELMELYRIDDALHDYGEPGLSNWGEIKRYSKSQYRYYPVRVPQVARCSSDDERIACYKRYLQENKARLLAGVSYTTKLEAYQALEPVCVSVAPNVGVEHYRKQ